MRKKHLGATKNKDYTPRQIPWRKVVSILTIVLVSLLVTKTYPRLAKFYAKNKPHITALGASTPPVAVAPTFEFYTELTKQEADEYSRQTKQLPHDLKKAQTASYTCYIQAGSFAQAGDAERMRAFLTLNGFTTAIKAVTLENHKTRHRVILGPFSSIAAAQDTQKSLERAAGVQSVLLKSAS